MKILMFCQYYYPESVGPTLFCEELVKKGNDVTVITGLPNYPEGIVNKEYKFFKKRKETINGVKIKRVFEIGRKKGKLYLALNYLSFMLSSSFKAIFLKGKYDIVFCYQLSPVTMAFPTLIYSKIHKKKSMLYCLDLWPESLKVVGIQENNIVFKILDKFSKFVYKKVDKVIVSTEEFKKYLSEKHELNPEEISYIPQFSLDYLADEVSENSTNKKYIKKTKKCIDFVYAGNCGFAQNIESLLEAVKQLKEQTEEKFILHIAGDGANLENLKGMSKKCEIEKYVKFHGFLQKEELIDLYNIADATIVTLTNNNFIGSTLPLKLISYMSLGKPIIASLDGEVAKLLKKEKIAIVTEEKKDLKNIMFEIIKNKEKYSIYGKNARKYYETNFTKEKFVDKFLEEFNFILGGNKNV